MKYFFTSISLFLALICHGQKATHQSNWQQEVNYKIEVALNDTLHQLSANIQIEYINNSPNVIDEIVMHLWPNGYSNRQTAFARQQLGNHKTEFHYSDSIDRGYIKDLDFSIDGKQVTWQYHPEHADIASLKLAKPLTSGERVLINTPFTVKIPGRFSRFGHVDDSYQITQWYPKPAVYDVNGWNEMPYLDQGEFYSEFGKFEVSISVPSNYVVAATGVLQNEEEWAFVESRINNKIDPSIPIPSSKEMKTLLYSQDNIHDFAWFAGKNLNIESSEVEIEGRTVRTFGYAAKDEFNFTKGIEKALTHYSEHVGPYPYDYCSVVFGALEAGGGMEYPMITVISVDENEVIIHEVGHNWFYGILGNNERNYPWMDESINSYFDHEASKFSFLSDLDPTLEKPSILENLFKISDLFMEVGAHAAELSETHQSVAGSSESFTEINYGTMVYGKGALLFEQLKDYLGQDVMDDCFHNYFNEWKFRHPLPGDIQRSFEKTSKKDLSWFFEGLLTSEEHVDFKAERVVDHQFFVERRGLVTPFSIGLFEHGSFVKEIFVQPDTAKNLTIQLPSDVSYDLIKIDPAQSLFEMNRQNNTYRSKAVFHKMEPFKLSLLTGLNNPNATQLYWMPVIGWNTQDKWMFGTYLGNRALPGRPFSWRIMPMFGVNKQEPTGYADLHYNAYRKGHLWKTTYGVQMARFSHVRFNEYMYNKVKPYVEFNFHPTNLRDHHYASIALNANFLSFTPESDRNEEITKLERDSTGRMTYSELNNNLFVNLQFKMGDKRALNPYEIVMGLTWGSYGENVSSNGASGIQSTDVRDNFTKLDFEWKKQFNYNIQEKSLKLRAYGAYYIDESNDGFYDLRLGSQGGKYDYQFDEVLMGRNATNGLFPHQVLNTESATRLVGNFGNINTWMASLNVDADLPFKSPVNVYADLFTFDEIDAYASNTTGAKFGYTGGLSVEVVPGLFHINLPLFSSSFIEETQKLQGFDKWHEKITFSFHLKLLKPEVGEALIGM